LTTDGLESERDWFQDTAQHRIPVELPGPISLAICLGVGLGIWVALVIIWPRARPPGKR